jgi:hypothetical protein
VEPFAEIQINREVVNSTRGSEQQAMNHLAEVFSEVGWPDWEFRQTGPARCAVPVPAEALEAAADKVCPEWMADGEFSIIPVS